MSTTFPVIRAAVKATLAARSYESGLNKNLRGGAWALVLALGFGATARAEDAPSDSGAASPTPFVLEEITVTGSHIKRANDFDSANPTTVIDSDYLQHLGVPNWGDALRQIPANISNNTPATTGNANFFTGSVIANLRGLNPYFGSRTMTLVNSRRFVPTNQGDGVDLNFIPSILIDRVDIVTGGASAAYGSGAITGVQNIFLNRKLEGGKIDMDYQQSSHSDGRDKHVGLAWGSGFLDDRAHFVIGGEWEKLDAIGCENARNWCSNNVAFITNPAPGAPSQILSNNVRFNQVSTTGVFQSFSPSPTTLQADANGTGTTPFAKGVGNPATFFNVAGGDGLPVYQYTNLRAPVNRHVASGTLTYALTDTVNMSLDASYGKVETTVSNPQFLPSQFQMMLGDNA